MADKRNSGPEIDNNYQKKLHKVTIGFVILMLLAGMYPLYSGWGFFDPSTIYFLISLIIAIVVFYVGMMAEQIFLIIASVLVVIISIVLMTNSISWRQAYVSKPFVLEAYIDEYPSYIDHMLTDLGLGDGDVVAFADDCIGTKDQGVQLSKMPQECLSLDDIQENYDVDVAQLLINYYNKMKSTARRIEMGQAEQIGYPFCVNTKSCAYIPLPPEGMSEEEIQSTDNQRIIILRDGFWDLIEKTHITPNICANMFLCNRLVDSGIMSRDEFLRVQRRQDPSVGRE